MSATMRYVTARRMYAIRTRTLRWVNPDLLHHKSQKRGSRPASVDTSRPAYAGYHVRQSRVKCRDADLERPEDEGVERPAKDLYLGAPLTVIILLRVRVDCCALRISHVAVGKPLELGAN